MIRLFGFSALVVAATLSSGCATCCAPFDGYYPSLTGRWVRHNPTSGRVGSMFDEAGAPADAIPASAAEPIPTSAEPLPAQQPQPRMMPANPAPVPNRMGPQTRSVIPRNMGETYLPGGR